MPTIKIKKSLTLEEAFGNFLLIKTSQGVTEATLKNYKSSLHCVFYYIDTSISLNELQKSDLQIGIAKMRATNLATNTIATYVRILRVFLSWAKEEGYYRLDLFIYHSSILKVKIQINKARSQK